MQSLLDMAEDDEVDASGLSADVMRDRIRKMQDAERGVGEVWSCLPPCLRFMSCCFLRVCELVVSRVCAMCCSLQDACGRGRL